MNTLVRVVNSDAPEAVAIAEAAAIIQSGGLVAFPTETVYGLGADATSARAIERIFAAKRRPATDPIIVHIAAPDDLARVALEVPDRAYRLAAAFWPGPLTLILRRGPGIPPNVSSGRDTVAVRMPAHPIAHALIEAAGVPVGAPSANLFSRPSATTAAHVLEDLDGRIDLLLDGGPTTIGLESTVLDLTWEQAVVLRPGGISLEQLREFLPNAQVREQLQGIETAADAPGQLVKHYSPRAEVRLYASQRDLRRLLMGTLQETMLGKRVGILLMSHEIAQVEAVDGAEVYDLGATLEDAARTLFAGLRDLDARGVDVIFAHGYAREGIGSAIWDRLLRAAEGRVQGDQGEDSSET
jgi:L-threonylcarbamoyladenylate synthase